MKKIFRSFLCIALVLILSTSIVLATDESGGGGMGGSSYSPPDNDHIPEHVIMKLRLRHQQVMDLRLE